MDEEALVTKNYFLEKYKFPDVIGCIDGTHVRIDRPLQSANSYYNRKDYFSIQVQVFCDHNTKFIDFYAGYPGSVHDARVFKNSTLYNKVMNTCISKYLVSL